MDPQNNGQAPYGFRWQGGPLGLFLLAIGFGIYFWWPQGNDPAGIPDNSRQMGSEDAPISKLGLPDKAAIQPKATPAKKLRRSKDAWLKWMNNSAHFRIQRIQEDGAGAIVACDSAAFEEIGLGDIGYRIINSIVKEWTSGLYPVGISKLTPQEITARDVEHLLPRLVSGTDNTSTFLFPIPTPLNPAAEAYRNNRTTALIKHINETLKWGPDLSEELRNAGPEFAEAVAEWCLAQPVLRRFGNAELTVTFENIELDGKQIFRVTESMPGVNGGPPVVNQFTSQDMPAPYDRLLLSK